ncbi:MAG TPA: RICIN domain-containing protein [Kineosporiaceae bacterium]|nr:RICIN domain-containing protein [Kineosporiaceae bacterium]
MRKNLAAGFVLTLLAGAVATVSAPSAAVAAQAVSVPSAALDADDYTGLLNYKSTWYMFKKDNDYVVQDQVRSVGGYWARISLSNGYYQYVNLDGGGLGIDGAKTTSGAAAYVGTYSPTALNQMWSFPKTNVTTDTGWAMIKNVKSGLCLGISSGSTAAGAAVAQYACNAGAANQAWKMNDPN